MTIAAAFRLLRDDWAITSTNSDVLAAIEQIEASHAALVAALQVCRDHLYADDPSAGWKDAIDAADAALAQAGERSDA